jgi:hypothetical protein
MLKQKDPLAWSFPWIGGVNCIESFVGGSIESIKGLDWSPEIEEIEKALLLPNLYDIYLAGMENCDKYRLGRYIEEYLRPKIESL